MSHSAPTAHGESGRRGFFSYARQDPVVATHPGAVRQSAPDMLTQACCKLATHGGTSLRKAEGTWPRTPVPRQEALGERREQHHGALCKLDHRRPSTCAGCIQHLEKNHGVSGYPELGVASRSGLMRDLAECTWKLGLIQTGPIGPTCQTVRAPLTWWRIHALP